MEFTYRIVGARQSSDCVDFQFFVVLEPSDIEGHLEKLNCLMTFTSVVIRQSEIIKDTCLSAPIVFSFKESQCNSEQAARPLLVIHLPVQQTQVVKYRRLQSPVVRGQMLGKFRSRGQGLLCFTWLAEKSLIHDTNEVQTHHLTVIIVHHLKTIDGFTEFRDGQRESLARRGRFFLCLIQQTLSFSKYSFSGDAFTVRCFRRPCG